MEGAPEVDEGVLNEAGLADGGEQLVGAGPSVLGLGLQGDLDEGTPLTSTDPLYSCLLTRCLDSCSCRGQPDRFRPGPPSSLRSRDPSAVHEPRRHLRRSRCRLRPLSLTRILSGAFFPPRR